MDGFDQETSTAGRPNGQYAYVPHNESKPYFDMAHEWVLADKMFASQLDESFVAHQYIIAAQAKSSVNVPDLQWGCDGGRDGFRPDDHARAHVRQRRSRPCFDYETLGDELDKAGL